MSGLAPTIASVSQSSQEGTLDVREEKQALRKEIRRQLKALTPEEIQVQSISVWDRLFSLPVYQNAQSVGLFLSMPSGEINTDAVIANAVQAGKDIYVPHVGANFELIDMQLIKVDYDRPAEALSSTLGSVNLFHYRWPKNKWGIPEPPPNLQLQPALPGDIDLMIIPGLAFDRSGNRLGQGKGYYDRFLSRLTADPTKKQPVLVAVGMDCQLLCNTATIPVHEHDMPVHWVLVPNETIAASHATSALACSN